MPFGVSDAFLRLADAEPRRALRRLGVCLSLAVVGYFVAELADAPRFGAFAWSFSVALAGGLVVGGLLARRSTFGWSDTLRTRWTKWNEAAIGAGSIAEAAARVEGGRLHRAISDAAIVGTIAIANGALAIAAWNVLPPADGGDVYGAFAFIVALGTGAATGAGIARALVEAVWSRAVARATMELVREGRIGVWGVR